MTPDSRALDTLQTPYPHRVSNQRESEETKTLNDIKRGLFKELQELSRKHQKSIPQYKTELAKGEPKPSARNDLRQFARSARKSLRPYFKNIPVDKLSDENFYLAHVIDILADTKTEFKLSQTSSVYNFFELLSYSTRERFTTTQKSTLKTCYSAISNPPLIQKPTQEELNDIYNESFLEFVGSTTLFIFKCILFMIIPKIITDTIQEKCALLFSNNNSKDEHKNTLDPK